MKDEHTTSKGNQTHGLSERIGTSAQTMQQVHILLSVAIACGDQWYDFALGKGGNIIALAQLLYNTDDVGAALQHIAADMNNPKSTKAKPPIPTQVETDKMDKVHIQELSYPVLMSYLRSRHVDADIGKRYCKEIWYTFKGKRYFGIAFPNNRDGYELRNPYYKGWARKTYP